MGEILAYISKEDANVGAEVCQPYAPMLGTSMYAGSGQGNSIVCFQVFMITNRIVE